MLIFIHWAELIIIALNNHFAKAEDEDVMIKNIQNTMLIKVISGIITMIHKKEDDIFFSNSGPPSL